MSDIRIDINEIAIRHNMTNGVVIVWNRDYERGMCCTLPVSWRHESVARGFIDLVVSTFKDGYDWLRWEALVTKMGTVTVPGIGDAPPVEVTWLSTPSCFRLHEVH